MSIIRRNHYDVTDTIFLANPQEVCGACCGLLRNFYPAADWGAVEHAFDTFARLYMGTLRGYVGCDTWYHDAQHSLDCALVMARLLNGHERAAAPADRLGERRARLGVIAALFHDAGYVRKTSDPEQHGAEFTLYHVARSGAFLAEYLPQIGFAPEAPMVEQMVHYTGYEVALDNIHIADARDRTLGFLLGTADVLAQMSDRCYLEKCRDFLWAEFEICGLAGAAQPGGPTPIYATPEDLLRKTPEFKDQIWKERLDGYFGGVYRHLETHFSGRNKYLDTIDGHLGHLRGLIGAGQVTPGLRRRAEYINALPLRQLLGVEAPVHESLTSRPRPARNVRRDRVDVSRFIPT